MEHFKSGPPVTTLTTLNHATITTDAFKSLKNKQNKSLAKFNMFKLAIPKPAAMSLLLARKIKKC